MDWLQVILLALIQGVTEFLPISSSAHLVLPAQLLGWPDQGLAFDVGVHFGTLLAVLSYFYRDLSRMATAVVTWPVQRRYTTDLDWVFKLAAATLPVAVAGLVLKDFVEDNLRSVAVIATTTILFALALWYADYFSRRTPATASQSATWLQALGIGFAQIFAIVPGTSRSGVTITAALLLGMSRTAAARFSFLLAIPTIAGAQLLLTLDLLAGGSRPPWPELVAATFLAGVSAYLCIHFFIRLVERTGMLPYVIYRLLLGLVLVVFLF